MDLHMLAFVGIIAMCSSVTWQQPECAGELLHNGICLPRDWPPRWPTPNGLPPRAGNTTAPWIDAPPAVINISTGRQLFVDTFLIESMLGLQLLNHAARWEEAAVLGATEPWEAMRSVPNQSWPQASRAIGYAQPFSGGVWWDDAHRPRACYRAWYACGSNNPETSASSADPGGCCYAESDDGVHFTKPRLGARGTNVVLEESFDGNVVWLDHTAVRADERWKMATVPARPSESGPKKLFLMGPRKI
jgi:hypothetical protein